MTRQKKSLYKFIKSEKQCIYGFKPKLSQTREDIISITTGLNPSF